MKKYLKNFLKYSGVIIILIATYFFMLFITSLIPSSAIKEKVKESAKYLLNYETSEMVDIKYREINLFQFTNALMLNTAYSIDSKKPIDSMLTARKNYIPGVTKIIHEETPKDLQSAKQYYKNGVITTDAYQSRELYDTVNENNLYESFEYARYWHGYLIFLRPLLLIMNYKQMQFSLLILIVVLLELNFYYVYKRFNIKYAFAFLIAYLSVDTIILSKSINEATCFIISLILTLILLVKKEKFKDMCMFFFIVGSITNFIDFLTNPIVTYGMPILIYIMLLEKEKQIEFKDILILFLKTGIAWTIGYGITWVSKWLLTDLILHKNVIKNALEQVLYRTHVKKYPVSYVKKILIMFLSKYTIFVVYLGLYVLNIYIKKLNNKKISKLWLIIFALPLIYYALVYWTSDIYMNINNSKWNIFKEFIYINTGNSLKEFFISFGLVFLKILIVLLNFSIFIDSLDFKGKEDLSKVKIIYPYLLGICIPLLWYAVLMNHSITHFFFSYRNLIISVFAFLVSIIKLNEKEVSIK